MTIPACMLLLLSAADPAANPEPAATAGNAFAVDLYQQLSAEEGNIFFSPLSLSTALAMTYAGADGETAREMAAVLHLPPDSAQIHQSYGALLASLRQEATERPYRLDIANALWLQDQFTYLKPFLDTVQRHYNAGQYTVNFAAANDAARKQINRWVADQTEDKIQDLIPAGALDAATRLVLTNAIYFKGDWLHFFNKDRTQDAAFHVSDDKEVQAPMMQQEAEFGFFRGEGFKALSMPYEGGKLAMLVLLPDAVNGITTLEKELNPARLDDWLGRLEPTRVAVTFPRFKATSQFELRKTLDDLGMKSAFTADADFSRMTGTPDLFISAVLHKAYADVNEEGTEAAAATGVVISKTSIPVGREEFVADHPFLYLIYDAETQAVLFLGRLSDPTASTQ